MELLTVQQAAERKRVSVKSIYHALMDGRLTRHEQYGRVLVSAAEVDAYQPRAGKDRPARRGTPEGRVMTTYALTPERERRVKEYAKRQGYDNPEAFLEDMLEDMIDSLIDHGFPAMGRQEDQAEADDDFEVIRRHGLVNVPPVDTASLRRDRLGDGEE